MNEFCLRTLRTVVKTIPILTVLLLPASPAAAQTGTVADKKVLVSFYGGMLSGGPSSDMEAAMIRQGFDQPSICNPCIGDIGHPKSSAFQFTGMLRAQWDVWGPLTLLGDVMMVEDGKSTGHAGDDLYLLLDYNMFGAAPSLGVHWRMLRAHAGPAFYRTRVTQENRISPEVEENLAIKTGAVAGGTLRLASGADVAVDVILQYRYVPPSTIGGYQVQVGAVTATFEADQASFSHLFFGIGFGLGF